jgi:hypothetical protein
MTFTCVSKNAASVNVASVGASAMAESAANAAGHTPAISPPVCLQCSVFVYMGFAVMSMHCFAGLWHDRHLAQYVWQKKVGVLNTPTLSWADT